MGSFSYRVRVETIRGRLTPTMDDDYHEIPDASGRSVRLSIEEGSGQRPQRITVRSSGFATRDEAFAAGVEMKQALGVAGVVTDVPMNLGDDTSSTRWARSLRDKLREDHGVDLRGDVHGIDIVDDDDPPPVYLRMEAEGQVGVPVDRFLTALGAALADHYDSPLAPRDRLAAEVFMAAAFEANTRARFLTHVTVLEILADRGSRPHAAVAVLQRALTNLDEVGGQLDDADYQSLRSGIAGLKHESISHSVRRLGTGLDPTAIPGLRGEAVEDFLSRCYELRSLLVHDGDTPENVDLRKIAGALHFLVRAILTARLV